MIGSILVSAPRGDDVSSCCAACALLSLAAPKRGPHLLGPHSLGSCVDLTAGFQGFANASRHGGLTMSSAVMLSLTLFREGDPTSSQLAGTVFVKTASDHTVERVAKAFCRWCGLPFEACTLYDSNKKQLDPSMTIAASGLVTSSPVIVLLSQAAPQPDAQAAAAPFTLVDVLDSELAATASGLGVGA